MLLRFVSYTLLICFLIARWNSHEWKFIPICDIIIIVISCLKILQYSIYTHTEFGLLFFNLFDLKFIKFFAKFLVFNLQI